MRLYFNDPVFPPTRVPSKSSSSSRCRAADRKNINLREFYSLYLFICVRIYIYIYTYSAEIVIIARLDQLSAYIMISVCIVADTMHTHFSVFAMNRYTISIEGGGNIFAAEYLLFFCKTLDDGEHVIRRLRIKIRSLEIWSRVGTCII